MTMVRSSSFINGVWHLDGAPWFFLGGGYAYHQDDAGLWQRRLQLLKETGLRTVTFSVPWRHHEVLGEHDFAGRTHPNRNLVGFLHLVKAAGLLAAIELGPFAGNEREPSDLPDDLLTRWPVAATARLLAWYGACLEAAVFPFAYPAGPVIALQLGLASNKSLDDDYSLAAVGDFWRRFGRETPVPTVFSPLAQPAEVLPYMRWGQFQREHLAGSYRRFSAPLREAGLPILAAQAPAPASPAKLDRWLARVSPERWPQLQYAAALGSGPISYDEEARTRHILACKRAAGPAMVEVKEACPAGAVQTFFKAVQAIAAGATGLCIQGALDAQPGSHQAGAEANTLRLLVDYLGRFNAEFATAWRPAPVNWALCPSYADLAGWSGEAADWSELGVKPPRCGERGLDNFCRTMRLENRDFGIVNVEETGRLDPAQYPALVFCGSFLMDAATQSNLLAYVRRGGTLIAAHDLPVLNQHLEMCTTLKEGLAASTGSGRFIYLSENPFETGPSSDFLALLDELGYAAPLAVPSPSTQAWMLRAGNGVEHYFVLSLDGEPGGHRAGPVSVWLPPRSAAILRVTQGRLTAALVKGVNDADGLAVVPVAAAGGVTVAAESACDLLWFAGEDQRVEVRP